MKAVLIATIICLAQVCFASHEQVICSGLHIPRGSFRIQFEQLQPGFEIEAHLVGFLTIEVSPVGIYRIGEPTDGRYPLDLTNPEIRSERYGFAYPTSLVLSTDGPNVILEYPVSKKRVLLTCGS